MEVSTASIGTGVVVSMRMTGPIAITRSPRRLFMPRLGDPAYPDTIRVTLRTLAAEHLAIDPSLWFQVYSHAAQEVSAGPSALNHNELASQQIGCTASGRLVMFDLETMAWLPFVSDVASILEELSELTGCSSRDLYSTYLSKLHPQVRELLGDDDAAWRLVLMTRLVRAVESLPWVEAMKSDSRVQSPCSTVQQIHRDMSELKLV